MLLKVKASWSVAAATAVLPTPGPPTTSTTGTRQSTAPAGSAGGSSAGSAATALLLPPAWPPLDLLFEDSFERGVRARLCLERGESVKR